MLLSLLLHGEEMGGVNAIGQESRQRAPSDLITWLLLEMMAFDGHTGHFLLKTCFFSSLWTMYLPCS